MMHKHTAINEAELRKEQREREQLDFEAAKKRADRRDVRAAQNGTDTRLSKLMGSIPELSVISQAATTVLERQKAAKGRKPLWYPSAEAAGSELLGTLAVRAFSVLACGRADLSVKLLLRMAGSILMGSLWALEDLKEEEWKRAELGQKPKTMTMKRYNAALAKANKSVKKTIMGFNPEMSEEELIKQGVALWEVLAEAGLVTMKKETRITGRKTKNVVETPLNCELTEKGQELRVLLSGHRDILALIAPIYRPMVCKPRPWTSFYGGGYLTKACPTRLIRTHRKEVREDVVKALEAGEMDKCLEAVNILQSVPLRINEDALSLRRLVWAERISIPGVTPSRERMAIPVVPDMTDWSAGARVKFLIKRSASLNHNKAIPALEAEWLRDGQEAEDLLDRYHRGLPFYLPHSLDHRGRTYATPTFSHQRGDAVKSLFDFFNGQPLGDDGLDGLKIHVANCGDFEKISKETFEDRIAWVDDHIDVLMATADDPEHFLMWKEADAPFSFYAAICDLTRALRSPDPREYVSHIRVDLDGCNSGVQHYSMIMGAEEGALVGLAPGKPADLYSDVAKICMTMAERERVSFEAEETEEASTIIAACKEEINAILSDAKGEDRKPTEAEKAEIAFLKKRRDRAAGYQWAKAGITRSTVKRPTMTYGYSAEAYGFAEQISTDHMEPLSNLVALGELERHPFGADEGRQASFWLGRAIFQAVQELLPNVARGMEWLKNVGDLCGKQNTPLRYKTYDGFPVTLAEYEEEIARLPLHITDQNNTVRLKPGIMKPTNKLNSRRMRSSISPNVIHSCDASHLRHAVRLFSHMVSTDIMTIHDCFGSHASNWRKLHETLNESLVWLYCLWNPLDQIMEVKSLSALEPCKGRDMLGKVLAAEYAFS